MKIINGFGIYVWVLLLMLSINNSGSAQPVSFGLKGGINVSNYVQADEDILVSSLQPDGDFDNSVGETITGFFNGRVKNTPLSFQLEVSFKRLGSEFQVDLENAPFQVIDFDQTYISVSAMPRVDLFPASRFNPNFMFGPYADISLESKLSFITDEAFLGEKINGRTNNFALGAQLIVGVEADINVATVSVQAQYGTTFTNIFSEEITISNQPNDIPIGVEDAKHQFFGFLIGFHVPLQN